MPIAPTAPQKLRLSASVAILLACFATGAIAAPPPIAVQAGTDENAPPPSPGLFGFLDGINRSSALLGDLWGLRTELSKVGVTLSIQETSEYLGNTSGGTQRSFAYDGLTEVLLQLDTQRAFRHYGGLFNMSLLNIHGKNLSARNLQTLQTASGIESDDGTRLWELWYDQKFLDEDRLDVKIGQQSLDQEFMVSTNSAYFINTMMGWPMLPSADMPAGGPAYPLSALGVRLSARPVNGVTLLAGVFSGDPVKNDNGSDPQQQNRHGTSFPLNSGQLYIAEAQFSYPAAGSMVVPGQAKPLGWTYRLGAWYNNNKFADQRLDAGGLSLADPASTGVAAQHRGDWAWYAVADQLTWVDPNYPDRNIAVFARLMGTPLKDRNPIDASVNAGAVFHSPFANRPADTLGLGFGYAHVSSSLKRLDADTASYTGLPRPLRTGEGFAELSYQYQWKPWLQLQPDLQYVINPGGGLPLNGTSGPRIGNEVVLGLRAIISL
ncbi:MAG: carbohydrate porin [Paucibacter sp.]|nr:carbohydrate porin [Roseateles sp.]